MNDLVFSSIDLVTSSTVICVVVSAKLFGPFWGVDNPVVLKPNSGKVTSNTLSVKYYSPGISRMYNWMNFFFRMCKNYDLCSQCENFAHKIHDQSHVFLVIKHKAEVNFVSEPLLRAHFYWTSQSSFNQWHKYNK